METYRYRLHNTCTLYLLYAEKYTSKTLGKYVFFRVIFMEKSR